MSGPEKIQLADVARTLGAILLVLATIVLVYLVALACWVLTKATT